LIFENLARLYCIAAIFAKIQMLQSAKHPVLCRQLLRFTRNM